jgi:hypothetical protein
VAVRKYLLSGLQSHVMVSFARMLPKSVLRLISQKSCSVPTLVSTAARHTRPRHTRPRPPICERASTYNFASIGAESSNAKNYRFDMQMIVKMHEC